MKILFFTSETCAPCKKVKPIIKQIALEENIDVDELDVRVHYKTAQIFNVIATPTFVVLDAEGEEVNRVSGAKPKADLLDALDLSMAPVYDPATEEMPKGVLTRQQMKVQGGLV